MSAVVALFSPGVSPTDRIRAEARGKVAGICDAIFVGEANPFLAWCESDCAPGTLTAFRRAYTKSFTEVAADVEA